MISLVSFIDKCGLREEINQGLYKIGVRLNAATLGADFWNKAAIWKMQGIKGISSLGYCDHVKQIIGINFKLLEVGRDEELRSTLLHEAAHMIHGLIIRTYMISGDRKPHGKLWKYIAIQLGDDGGTTASYKFFSEFVAEKRAERGHKHEYICKDCGHVYKQQRILKNVATRFHGPCRSKTNHGRLTHTVVR